MLSDAESNYLMNAPDLNGSMRDLMKSSGESRRRRRPPNVFSTLGGRPQPRQDFLSPEARRAIYIRSEPVRASIDTIVETISDIPWSIRPLDKEHTLWLRKKKPKQYKLQKKRLNWLVHFFSHPNRWQGLRDLNRMIVRDLLIQDAGAFEIVTADYGNTTLPIELGAIAGETIEVETDQAGVPVRYHQSYNVLQNVAFEPEEVAYLQLHPATWSPYGLSAIDTAYINIFADLEANRFNSAFFAKNGIPPGLLGVMGVDDKQFKSLLTQLRNTSADNPHNIHAFRIPNTGTDSGNPNNLFSYVPLSPNQKDMEFMGLLDHVIKRITMVFGLTPSQIGYTADAAGGIGSEISQGQTDLYKERAIGPVLTKLASTYTEKVIHDICGWTDLEFAFEQPNTPQAQMEYQHDTQEVQMGVMTQNEFRAKHGGREPLKSGDYSSAPPPEYMQNIQMQMQQQMQQQMGGMSQQEGGQQEEGQPPMQKSASNHKRITIEL